MLKRLFLVLLIGYLTACTLPAPEPLTSPVSPIMPEEVPVIADNQWRLTEVVYRGEQGNFDSIEPVLATFHPGMIAMRACNSTSLVFDTNNKYKLIQGEGTARQCENGGTEQEAFIEKALLATDRYELLGNTLIFSGRHAKVTFVLDNDARKPPDWT